MLQILQRKLIERTSIKSGRNYAKAHLTFIFKQAINFRKMDICIPYMILETGILSKMENSFLIIRMNGLRVCSRKRFEGCSCPWAARKNCAEDSRGDCKWGSTQDIDFLIVFLVDCACHIMKCVQAFFKTEAQSSQYRRSK